MPEKRNLLSLSVTFGGLLTLLLISVASSMPILMDHYNEHPQMRPEYRDECVLCHVNADGSGKLTAFGKKYDRADLELTAELIREYPNLFLVDGALATGNPSVTSVQGEDAGDSSVVVPGNEPFDPKKYYLSECKECHGKYGDGDPFQGVPAFATAKWIAERSHLTDELLRILLYGKDKMKGQAGKISGDEARELLTLVRAIAEKYS
jgi:mono/diheme cytochrome c family protein